MRFYTIASLYTVAALGGLTVGCGEETETLIAKRQLTKTGGKIEILTGLHPDIVDIPPPKNDFKAPSSGPKAERSALPSPALLMDGDDEGPGDDAAPIESASAPAH